MDLRRFDRTDSIVWVCKSCKSSIIAKHRLYVCLKDNFEKVQSYEATLLSHGKRWIYLQEISSLPHKTPINCRVSQDQEHLQRIFALFPDEDDITIPRLPKNTRLIPYHLPVWTGRTGLGSTKISINADIYVFSKVVEITVMILCHVKISINGVIEVKSLGLDIIILNLSAVDRVFCICWKLLISALAWSV